MSTMFVNIVLIPMYLTNQITKSRFGERNTISNPNKLNLPFSRILRGCRMNTIYIKLVNPYEKRFPSTNLECYSVTEGMRNQESCTLWF